MPWKECNTMDERLRPVARLLDGEKMAVMCREYLAEGRHDVTLMKAKRAQLPNRRAVVGGMLC